MSCTLLRKALDGKKNVTDKQLTKDGGILYCTGRVRA